MRILMTGATGFIGSRIAAALVKDKADLTVIKRPHSDTWRLAGCLAQLHFVNADPDELSTLEGPFDVIIHCATDYGLVPGSDMDFPNYHLPKLLLAQAARWGAGSFITLDTMLCAEISAYARSKAIFREYLQTQEHVRAISLMSDYVYGPAGHDNSFMVSTINRLLENAPSIALTPGKQVRDFIYIDDVVSAVLCVIAHLPKLPKGYSRFEAGTESPASIRELVESLRTLTGNSQTVLEFGAVPYREHEQMHTKACNDELYALGWGSEWNLPDGLKNTIHYERQKRCAS